MDERKVSVGLVIMASGLGVRFGGNKLLEKLGDKPIIKWILDTTDRLFDKRVVVTRSHEVQALCDEMGVDCVLHDLPNRNDTVRLGLSHLMADVDICFFSPADQPLVRKKSIMALIETARSESDVIVRPCFLERDGAPVGFPKKYFDELLMLPEKKGGNYVVSRHLDSVRRVQVTDEAELWDIDTPEDFEHIKQYINERNES